MEDARVGQLETVQQGFLRVALYDLENAVEIALGPHALRLSRQGVPAEHKHEGEEAGRRRKAEPALGGGGPERPW